MKSVKAFLSYRAHKSKRMTVAGSATEVKPVYPRLLSGDIISQVTNLDNQKDSLIVEMVSRHKFEPYLAGN